MITTSALIHHGFCMLIKKLMNFVRFHEQDKIDEQTKLIKNLTNSIVFSMSIRSSEITLQYIENNNLKEEKSIRSGDVILIYNAKTESYLTCGNVEIKEALIERYYFNIY